MRKHTISLHLAAFCLLAMATTASAQTTYTWLGGTDTNWTNAANWDVNGVPVDANLANALLERPLGDLITFAGSTMPDTGIPSFGGTTSSSAFTPFTYLKSGGELDLTIGNVGYWIDSTVRTVLTVGDGVSGAGEDVTLNLALGSWLRNATGPLEVVVNSDGALHVSNTAQWSWGNFLTRDAKLIIDGGTVTSATRLGQFSFDPLNEINFLSEGGSFTALYGGDYANITAITTAVDDGINFTAASGLVIDVTDNGGSFTLTAIIPEPSSFVLVGLFGLAYLIFRRRG